MTFFDMGNGAESKGLAFPAELGPEDRADISAQFLYGLIKRSSFGHRNQKATWESTARTTYQIWKEPLELLEMFIALSTQMSGSFSTEFYSKGVFYKALCHIHGVACSTSLSVYTLLSYGLADQALVCWRNLYELAVIGQYILDNPSVAQRYHDHRYIKELQGLQALRDSHPSQSNNEALLNDIREMEQIVYELSYGERFSSDYGWTENGTVNNFRELEDCVGLDTFRPIYEVASNLSHADANSVFSRISLALSELNGDDEVDTVLYANTPHGLALPGSWTAEVLAMLNGVLLRTRPSFFPHDVYAIVSNEMADEIRTRFNEVTPPSAIA